MAGPWVQGNGNSVASYYMCHTHFSSDDPIMPSLSRIVSLAVFKKDMEALRSETYSEDNVENRRTLLEVLRWSPVGSVIFPPPLPHVQLWDLLMPSVPLESRTTKQWQQIGFQGADPATDFRGMGMLGLQCLQYPHQHMHPRSTLLSK